VLIELYVRGKQKLNFGRLKARGARTNAVAILRHPDISSAPPDGPAIWRDWITGQ
jgi:hypothetical protein